METTTTTVAKRKGGCGKKKIEIKKIENKNYLQATFSKRRQGLFRKAAELNATYGADIAVIVQSPGGGKIYASGDQSTITSIVDRYLAATSSSSTTPAGRPDAHGAAAQVHDDDGTAGGSTTAHEDTLKYVQILEEIENEKIKQKSLMERQEGAAGCTEHHDQEGRRWWERRRIDDLDVNELEEYIGAMETLRKNISAKAEEKAAKALNTNAASTAGLLPFP